MRRNVPPVPADAYTYLFEVKKIVLSGKIISDFPVSSQANSTRSIFFNLLIFIIHKITGLSLEKSFHFNFYLGVVFLAPALYLFLNNFFSDKKDRERLQFLAVGLFSFALFTGEGGYHGFYWIVPSFYSLLFFILLLSQVFSKKNSWRLFAFIFSVLFIFSHPVSFYASLIFPLFLGFYICFKHFLFKVELKDIIQQDKELFKRLVFVFLACITVFITSRLVFRINEMKFGETHGAVKIVSRVIRKEFEGQKIVKIALLIFRRLFAYFKYIFFNPILFLTWVVSLISLFKQKRIKMLSIYFSCLAFFLLSILHPLGYRSLIFLWPVTFLFFGIGLYETFRILRNAKLKIGLALLTFCFFLWSLVYGLIQPRSLHATWNFSWDRKCADFLIKNTAEGETILYSDRMGLAAFSTYGLVERKAILMEAWKKWGYNSNLKINYVVLKTVSNPKIALPSLELKKIKNCGFFTIYKIKNEN